MHPIDKKIKALYEYTRSGNQKKEEVLQLCLAMINSKQITHIVNELKIDWRS